MSFRNTLDAIAEGSLTASLKKVLAYRAVEAAMGADRPANAASPAALLAQHQRLVDRISEQAGAKLSAGQSAGRLRCNGAQQLASRMRAKLHCRNAAAHRLAHDVERFLSSRAHSVQASGGPHAASGGEVLAADPWAAARRSAAAAAARAEERETATGNSLHGSACAAGH